jgi:hypothetical protein
LGILSRIKVALVGISRSIEAIDNFTCLIKPNFMVYRWKRRLSVQVHPQVKSAQSVDKNVIIIAVMILFILPFALTIFLQAGGQVDDEGFATIESWLAMLSMPFPPWNSLPLQLTSGFFVFILVAEWVRSHIGEKRFNNRTIEDTKSIMITPGWRH